MERLGLWGEGAVFSSFDAFLDTVQKKGLGKFTFTRHYSRFEFNIQPRFPQVLKFEF